jgi:hypothetical protein
MAELKKVTIILPPEAFHQNRRVIEVKAGDSAEKVYTLIRDTKAHFVSQSPILHPSVVHISTVSCNSPDFKYRDIFTITIDTRGEINKLYVRKPFTDFS